MFAGDPQAEAVVRFWRDAGPKMWFAKDAAFDDEFRRRFLDLHFSVSRCEKDSWGENPYASLALVLLLDQFPRNAFRGSAHMFATDALALCYARKMIASGAVMQVDQPLRLFACVPFIHSENLDDQRHALDLYKTHAPDAYPWAEEHCDIIRRFGRFPHRNAMLGRNTTSEEQAFLDAGGFAG
ncbi:MAG: DUF924 family protein [Burkholderiaceae bacterium]|nr:MAG: DUF924 family protein [Burkholderiaceae bacterium]